MATKKKQDDASKQDLRRKIEEDTEVFLKSGGEIQQIPSGHSGVNAAKPGAKHIKLGNSK